MLMTTAQSLRRRRAATWVLALLAVVAVAVVARAAIMSLHGHEPAGDPAAICLALGACVLVAGATVPVIRRTRPQPLWAVVEPHPPIAPVLAAPCRHLARAGPPVAFLQVFRL